MGIELLRQLAFFSFSRVPGFQRFFHPKDKPEWIGCFWRSDAGLATNGG
jgi:hypothetical protein